MTSPCPLPQTLEAAHAEIVSAQAVIGTLSKKLAESLHENELLRQKIDKLCRRYFNNGSEKVSADQLAFAFARLAEAESAPAGANSLDLPELPGEEPKHLARRKPTGRKPFPPNLPRRRVVISAAPEERHCHCGDEKQVITEKVSERLGYEPGSFYVEELVREVSVCKKCHDGVTVPPMPPQAIDGCAATSGLLAHVVVSKYVEHLPLYRLERQFARMGVDLSRSTLCGQLELVEEALAPLGEELIKRVRAGPYIQFDDTSVRVLTEREGERYYGKVWVYLSPGEQLVAFDATTTREHIGPLEFLRGFSGYLQGDAFSGNLTLRHKAPVSIVGCMTHLRRKFVEALEKDPRAAYFVALIRRLYDIEEAALGGHPKPAINGHLKTGHHGKGSGPRR
jgi:transposase